MSAIKSCFNCKHLKSWHDSGDRETPPDSGWECGHPNYDHLCEYYEEPAEEMTDEQFAAYCAHDCEGYEFHDWEAEEREREEALAREIEADKALAQGYHQRYPDLYQE